MSERDTYYRTLHNALQKGMDEHEARKAAYIASQQDKPPKKPKKKGRS